MAWIRSLLESSRKSWRWPCRVINNTRNHIHSEIMVYEDFSKNDLPITLNNNPYKKETRKCILCRLNIEPDYKNVRMLSQFQSVYTGRIYGRHITGLCLDKQQRVEREILKAQNCGFMAVYHKNPKYVHDPKFYDPDNPFRPHKY